MNIKTQEDFNNIFLSTAINREETNNVIKEIFFTEFCAIENEFVLIVEENMSSGLRVFKKDCINSISKEAFAIASHPIFYRDLDTGGMGIPSYGLFMSSLLTLLVTKYSEYQLPVEYFNYIKEIAERHNDLILTQ